MPRNKTIVLLITQVARLHKQEAILNGQLIEANFTIYSFAEIADHSIRK